MQTAMITGITGQDGSYLAELLLAYEDYKVVGIHRRASTDTTERLKGIIDHPRFELIEGDVTDAHNVNFWFHTYQPDEFYNLAAQSHVGTSFKQPMHTWDVNAGGVMNILESIRVFSPDTKLYQASTSEMFGKNFSEKPAWQNEVDYLKLAPEDRNQKYQDEKTVFAPQSPYAVAKVAAHHSVQLYREAYGLHASCGILFNHESERRGEQFVTRKITKWLGEYINWRRNTHEQALGFDDADIITLPVEGQNCRFPKLRLGNWDAMRDWGHAADYVRGMWLMLQQDQPDDYVLATGETHSVKEFLDCAFAGIHIDDWTPYVVQDPKFYRPAEVEYLLGDPSKAKAKLGWVPEIKFENLVQRMVEHDIEKAKKAQGAEIYS